MQYIKEKRLHYTFRCKNQRDQDRVFEFTQKQKLGRVVSIDSMLYPFSLKDGETFHEIEVRIIVEANLIEQLDKNYNKF